MSADASSDDAGATGGGKRLLRDERQADGRRLVEEKRVLLLGTRSATAYLGSYLSSHALSTVRLSHRAGLEREHGPRAPQGLPSQRPTALRWWG